MPDFGFHYEGFRHHHHRHHRFWDPQIPEFEPPIDPDMGCDPSYPGFRAFGDDGPAVDDGTPEDDGSGGQGGVLDAVTQVASGVADVIAPSAPAVYYDPRFRRHRHHHFAPPPIIDRYEAERLRRLEFERHGYPYGHPHHRFWGDDRFGFSFAPAPPTGQIYPGQIPPPAVSLNPQQRYGQNGYRPRGPRHGGGFNPYHHGHHHHHHRGGYQGQPPPPYGQQGGQQNLPPGSYLQTCTGCTYDGNNLNCSCQNMQGQYQPTSAQVPPGTAMSNQNGNLTPGM